MRARENLKALEKALEREVLEFWTWLGAGEAPETWESAVSAFSEQKPVNPASDGDRKSELPRH